MKNWKKILLLVPLCGFLFPSMTCQAKVEQTTEIELVDMGNGIIVPSSFEVKNADGSFATLSGIDPAQWQEQAVDEQGYSVILDNGYRAEKNWLYTDKTLKNGYKYITVYNENNEAVCYFGQSPAKGLVFSMKDEEGNMITNLYSRSVLYEDGYSIHTKSFDDGKTISPMERITYDADEDASRDYILYGDMLKLSSKFEYGREGGGVCTTYSLCKGDSDYSQEEDYYEVCSYKKDDLQEYTFVGPIYDPEENKVVYGPNKNKLPSRITQNGQELYFYKVTSRNDNWSTPEEKKLMEGKEIEYAWYFTEEQVEVLKKENLIYYDEIMEKYPDFFDSYCSFGEPEIVMGEEEDEEKPEDAIISPSSEPEKEENAAENSEISEEAKSEEESGEEESGEEEVTYHRGNKSADGSTVYWQELTGDVVPINGAVPKMLMTQIQNTPAGEQIGLQLMDENYNMLANNVGFSLEHTNYKYAYLTMIDMTSSYVMFDVAGSDTPISGNLQYSGSSTVQTENGEETNQVYMDMESGW